MYTDVELREIRVFLTLAEELHFGRTGERLGITSSRVSQTIGALERRLGTRLVDRTSRRVALTAAGTRLHDRLRPTVTELQLALAEASGAAAPRSGELRLGMFARVVGGPHLDEITERFMTENPGWRCVSVDAGVARNYLDALRSGEVDLLAARLPLTDPEFTVGPQLSDEDRFVLVRRDHHLARRESLTFEDLAGETLSYIPAFPREMMDAFAPESTPSGRPIHRVSSQSVEEYMMAVASGACLHPTVRSMVDYVADPRLVAIPVTDMPRSLTALVWLTNDRRPIIKAFVHAAQVVLSHHQLQLA